MDHTAQVVKKKNIISVKGGEENCARPWLPIKKRKKKTQSNWKKPKKQPARHQRPPFPKKKTEENRPVPEP